MSVKGVDISIWQSDFKDLTLLKKAGFEFAIIKGSEGQSTDRAFEQHYANAETAGIARGVYVFSHANSVAKANAEAQYIIKVLNGRPLEMPIFVDLEADDINFAWNHNIMDWVLAFGETIKAAGYRWGTYSNQSWYLNKLNLDQLKEAGAVIWVAAYNGTQLTIEHDIHQYNNVGRIPGYNANLDMNLLYDESVIQWNGEQPQPEPEPKPEQPEEPEQPTITANDAISQIVALAKAQVGYKEKRTNDNLYDFTANAGSGNWNMYAKDIDTKWPNFYNGKKNGYSWCDIFVDWLFLTKFGYENALKMLYAPEKSAGAGCSYSANFYRAKGQFFNTPKVGDQVFFGQFGNEGHTGIVIAVEGNIMRTIEGNTSGGAGIDANGDGVYEKTYNWRTTYIPGYGRPNYATVSNGESSTTEPETPGEFYPLISYSYKGDYVKKAQQLLIEKGYSCGSYGADGDFGNGTLVAVRKFQQDNGLEVDGVIGEQTWAALLAESQPEPEPDPTPGPEPDQPSTGTEYTVTLSLLRSGSQGAQVRTVQQLLAARGYYTGDGDGIFGELTKRAVMAYQADAGLDTDGEVGGQTWAKLIKE